MGNRLIDKVAVITGASRGIGYYITLGFAEEGAKLVIASRNINELKKTAKKIENIQKDILICKVDISSEKDVFNMSREINKRYGKVDILINNAGILGPVGFITNVKTIDWIRTININLIGTYLCTKYILPFMIKKKYGKIINLSGGGAAYPKPLFSSYASSKAAIIRFTENLAEELRKFNIQVNAIAPGGVKTKMQEDILSYRKYLPDNVIKETKEILAGGGTLPSKIVNLALFLATDESNGLTGKFIHVNDSWQKWSELDIKKLNKSELYTLRRINSV